MKLISDHGRKLLARYMPRLVAVSKIKPSPENAEVYGAVNFENDPALETLVRSITRRGLEEPLILTDDNFILSGHRRFFAIQQLKWKRVPARYAGVKRSDTPDYHRLLTEYNPQRVKSVAATLAERLLAAKEDEEDAESWTEYHKAKGKPRVQRMNVAGVKSIDDVGDRQAEFLRAAQTVIEQLRNYWPLSVRQVHYKLLNNPPLTQTTKDGNERWRYRNDMASYKKLCSLLVSARYHGYVPWDSIDDFTRESQTYSGFNSVHDFLEQELDDFLTGYHRNRQEGQPNHIELIVEKNTLLNVLRDISEQFYIPLTALRGYAGPSIWREIELRWRDKVENHPGPHRPKCILIIVSDHDPEGLNLADDAVRSLRDRHGVDVIATRPALTLAQAREYNLHPNPAKETSTRFMEYVRRTGTTDTWEVEALDPEVLREQVYNETKRAMDVNQLNAVQECQARERTDIRNIKERLGVKMREMLAEGEM